MAWALLGIAVVAEVMATLALRGSGGLSRLWPSVVVFAGYGIAFVLLARALRTISVGPAYAIWSGLGTVGAAVGGWLLFAERPTPLTITGMVLIIAGVVVMNLHAAPVHG